MQFFASAVIATWLNSDGESAGVSHDELLDLACRRFREPCSVFANEANTERFAPQPLVAR